VRDEGDKVTLTYKQSSNSSVITDTIESEVVVSNFEDTVAILEAAGLPSQSYQETRRETWRLDDVEVVLDEWPWLDPLLEIEGPSEDSVKATAARLGFDWSEALIGSVTQAYQRKYPKGIGSKLVRVSRVTFDEPVPSVISGE
jgi:adenylate cyclase class 2